jgi:hypothetical protein
MAGIYPQRRSIKVFCFFSSEKKAFVLPVSKAAGVCSPMA